MSHVQVAERVRDLVRRALSHAAESIRAAVKAPWPQWTSDLLPVVSFLTVVSTSKRLACAPLYTEIPTLQQSLQWFVQYHATALHFVATGVPEGAPMSSELCVTTFAGFRSMWPARPAEVEKALGADCLVECLKLAKGLEELPLMQAVVSVLESAFIKDVEAWQQKFEDHVEESDELFRKMIDMIEKLGDTRLQRQVEFLNDVAQTKRVTESLKRKKVAGAGSKDAMAISAVWVASVLPVRQAARSLEVSKIKNQKHNTQK